jgi:hypothetical protein
MRMVIPGRWLRLPPQHALTLQQPRRTAHIVIAARIRLHAMAACTIHRISRFSSTNALATRPLQAANMIVTSPTYQNNTLILVTWDEGGGFYDHVAPPADPPINVDADDSLPIAKTVPYGTRVPFLAIGTFAKTGTVSHVQMEHSSVVKFLEWNFLTQVGQLNARDAWVNNIGSLLDPSKTGVPVP